MNDMDRFQKLSSDLIGTTEEDAREMVAAAGCTFGVSRREDRFLSMSANYNLYRFVVEIQNGRVTSVTRG